MATIKKVEEFKKANNKKSWKFTMDDGTQGYSHPNNPEKPWEYKEGDVVGVKVESKGTYNLLHFTRAEESVPSAPPTTEDNANQSPTEPIKPPSLSKISSVMTISEMKYESQIIVFKWCMKLILAGKWDNKEAKENFVEWVGLSNNSIDELNSNKQ